MSASDEVPPVETAPEVAISEGNDQVADPALASLPTTASDGDIKAVLAAFLQNQAVLTKALSDQAEAHQATQAALTSAYQRIADLESTKVASEEDLQKTELEFDREKYLNVQAYAPYITTGFTVTPGVQETPKPHLFQLYGDRCSDQLQQDKKKASLEEYRVLYCSTFYLAATIVALKTEFVQCIEVEDESTILLKQVVETLEEVERWYRRRLAFIRVVTLHTESDPLFPEFLRSEIYGNADTEALGSEDVAEWARKFQDAKGKQTLAQGAKQAAQRQIKGIVTLPKPKPRSDDDSRKGKDKGKAKVSFAQDEKAKASQAGASGK